MPVNYGDQPGYAAKLPDRQDSGFRIIAAPGTDPRVISDMVTAAGSSAPDSNDAMFPPFPREGRCRICGTLSELTEEHLPPRGAFNKQRGRDISVDLVLNSGELDFPGDGPVVQGGVRGYVLCRSCNNTTGRWGREYQEWAARGVHLLGSQLTPPDKIDDTPGHPSFDRVIFKGVYPGRFVRQVLSMMLTISGSPALGERHPELRELALGGPEQPLPPPLHLYLLLYADPTSRFAGGPKGQAIYNVDVKTVQRVLGVDHIPFGLVLLLDGPPMDDFGAADISGLCESSVDRKVDLTLEGLPIGFGHKAWPCEYRTRGQLLADRIESDSGT